MLKIKSQLLFWAKCFCNVWRLISKCCLLIVCINWSFTLFFGYFWIIVKKNIVKHMACYQLVIKSQKWDSGNILNHLLLVLLIYFISGIIYCIKNSETKRHTIPHCSTLVKGAQCFWKVKKRNESDKYAKNICVTSKSQVVCSKSVRSVIYLLKEIWHNSQVYLLFNCQN